MIRAHCVIRPRTAAVLRSRRIVRALTAARERRCRCGGAHTKDDLHAAVWLVNDHNERINHGSSCGVEESTQNQILASV